MKRNLQSVAFVAAESGGAWSESSLRWLIQNADRNGLNGARVILRVGRKVLIDVDAFAAWIDAQQDREVGP